MYILPKAPGGSVGNIRIFKRNFAFYERYFAYFGDGFGEIIACIGVICFSLSRNLGKIGISWYNIHYTSMDILRQL